MSILKQKVAFDAWKDAVKQPEDSYKGFQMYPALTMKVAKDTPKSEYEGVDLEQTNDTFPITPPFMHYPGEDEDAEDISKIGFDDFDKANPDDLFKNFQSTREYEDARMNEISKQLSDVYKNKSKVSTDLSKVITKKYKDEVSPNYKVDEEGNTYIPRHDRFKDVFAKLGEQVVADNKDIQDRIDDAMEMDKAIYNKSKEANNIKSAINVLDKAIEYYNNLRSDPANLTKSSEYRLLSRSKIPHAYRGQALQNALAAAGINMNDEGFIDNATPETLAEARDRLEERLQKLYKFKDIRMDLQTDLTDDINKNFVINVKNIKMDTQKDLEDIAKPTLDAYTELITKYKDYLTPDVITKLKDDVDQLSDYMKDVGRIAADKSAKKTYLDMLKKIKHNVATNYKQIMDKLSIYSNSVSAEDAIINEIKSLASYEQYTQLPPAIFENLPEDIKKKCLYLMELKAKLQRQQGKTKNISQKYKINASSKPVSGDKESAKVLNPMLNRGYSIFNKVAQHNAYNGGFL